MTRRLVGPQAGTSPDPVEDVCHGCPPTPECPRHPGDPGAGRAPRTQPAYGGQVADVARPIPGRRTPTRTPHPRMSRPSPWGVAMQRRTRQTHDACLPARDATAFTTALQSALATDAVWSTDDNPTDGVVARPLPDCYRDAVKGQPFLFHALRQNYVNT